MPRLLGGMLAIAIAHIAGAARIQIAGALNRLMANGHAAHYDQSPSYLGIQGESAQTRSGATQLHVDSASPQMREQSPSSPSNQARKINYTSSLLHVQATSMAVRATQPANITAILMLGRALDNRVVRIPPPLLVLIGGVGFLILLCFCIVCMQAACGCTRVNGRNRYISDGGIGYEWDQTLNTITMYCRLLDSQSLEVRILPKHITINRKSMSPLLKEELFSRIDPETSTWSVTRKGELRIRLSKVEEAEWPCVVLRHDPSIKALLPSGNPRKSFHWHSWTQRVFC